MTLLHSRGRWARRRSWGIPARRRRRSRFLCHRPAHAATSGYLCTTSEVVVLILPRTARSAPCPKLRRIVVRAGGKKVAKRRELHRPNGGVVRIPRLPDGIRQGHEPVVQAAVEAPGDEVLLARGMPCDAYHLSRMASVTSKLRLAGQFSAPRRRVRSRRRPRLRGCRAGGRAVSDHARMADDDVRRAVHRTVNLAQVEHLRELVA